MKGVLDVGDPRHWWRETLDNLEFQVLAFRPDHVAEVYQLPPIHHDPFDRALIAQATVEDLALVTTDVIIHRYSSERFRTLA
jgi:PIN domain nuclease of toxin-antitoxin system